VPTRDGARRVACTGRARPGTDTTYGSCRVPAANLPRRVIGGFIGVRLAVGYVRWARCARGRGRRARASGECQRPVPAPSAPLVGRGDDTGPISYRFSVMSCNSNLVMYPFRNFAFRGRAAGLDAVCLIHTLHEIKRTISKWSSAGESGTHRIRAEDRLRHLQVRPRSAPVRADASSHRRLARRAVMSGVVFYGLSCMQVGHKLVTHLDYTGQDQGQGLSHHE
jgi:hypothetical protein